ncbi:MAG: nitrous oxide-stimulated promoter family protein [Solobacterium sp.]|nr:nitrous oxide-stimulated promoter family protein [Solobacterium sp.]
MNDTAGKREKEKRIVKEMIVLYCHGHHHAADGQEMCDECRALCDYAWKRSDLCPFMETKTFCSNCTVHCYQPEMREKIRTVMRWSGPRMIFHHPVMALSHAIASKREKRLGGVSK